MGFKSSVAYVQRQIDIILRPLRAFCRVYVDDIVVFSKTFDEHLSHLSVVFRALLELGISPPPDKTFIAFPSVQLLGQLVNGLGLATSEEKILAISRLTFPDSLGKLETYLGLTSWLRQYCRDYAIISKPLQDKSGLCLGTRRPQATPASLTPQKRRSASLQRRS